MTQPTHGLDPNALEAAPTRSRIRLHHDPETTAKALFERARHLDQVAGFGYEMGDFLTDLVPFLAALSQNPGTSNTSGEAVAIETTLRGEIREAIYQSEKQRPQFDWNNTDGAARQRHVDAEQVWEAREYNRLVRVIEIALDKPIASLEPRASDREAVEQGLERAAKWHDQRARDTPDAFEMEFHQVSAAAIRKLSEVSHV
jgi:hypothetical protein